MMQQPGMMMQQPGMAMPQAPAEEKSEANDDPDAWKENIGKQIDDKEDLNAALEQNGISYYKLRDLMKKSELAKDMFADYMAYSQPLFALNGIKTDGARRLIDIYWPWYLASGNIVVAMDMRSQQIVGVLTGYDYGQFDEKIDHDAFDEWVDEQEGAEGVSTLQMGLVEGLVNEHERLKEDGRANDELYRCGGNIAVRRDVI